MIDVPERVKELLKKDGVRKNFRVHFPNGECEDICNNRLITESVTFTESVCSQSRFKLGLCESSVLRFECVDVPNIKGEIIEAQIEIDCSEVEQSYSWIETKDDVSFPFFPIKYGTFVIDSCDRNANSVKRRKVTAYSIDYSMFADFTKTSVYNYIQNGYWYKSEDLLIPFEALANSIFPPDVFDYYVQNGTSTEQEYTYLIHNDDNLSDEGISLKVRTVEYNCINENDGNYEYTYSNSKQTTQTIWAIWTKLIGIEKYYKKVKVIKEELLSELKSKNVSQEIIEKTIYALEDRLKPNIVRTNYKGYTVNEINNKVKCDYDKATEYIKADGVYNLSRITELLQINTSNWINTYAHSDTALILIPYSIDLYIDKYQFSFKREIDYTIIKKYSNQKIYSKYYDSTLKKYVYYNSDGTKCLLDEYIGTPLMLFKRTSVKQSSAINTESYTTIIQKGYHVADCWLLQQTSKQIVESYCELRGKMGKVGRDGMFSLITLKPPRKQLPSATLYPSSKVYPINEESVNSNCYSSIWYDDVMSLPFGKIKLTYTNSSEKVDYEKILSDNEEIKNYELTNNIAIANIPIQEDGIESIVNELAENINDIQYMPCKITMKGLPYLEAGDYLRVVTNYDEVFETLIFRQTIKGIQSLKTTIETRG